MSGDGAEQARLGELHLRTTPESAVAANLALNSAETALRALVLDSTPTQLTVDTTQACNLDCVTGRSAGASSRSCSTTCAPSCEPAAPGDALAEAEAAGREPAEPRSEAPDCTYPWRWMMVGVEGEVRPCCFMRHTLGSLRESSLEEVWNGEAFQTLRRDLSRSVLPRACHGAPCKYAAGTRMLRP